MKFLNKKLKLIYNLPGRIGSREAIFIQTLWLNRMNDGRPPLGFLTDVQPRPEEERKEIIKGMKELLVPNAHLAWIKSDSRQLFLLSQLIDRYFPLQVHTLQNDLSAWNKLVAQIDIFPISVPLKSKKLEELKKHYNYVIMEDRIFDNIKGNKMKSMCLHITEWLEKKHGIKLEKPIISQKQVLQVFDQFKLNRKEKLSCMKSIKNRQAQQKFKEKREQENKKQLNVYLPLEVIEKLKEMSKNEQTNQGEYLKLLIEAEWKRRH